VTFWTVSVGRRVESCSPFMGETGAGAVRVTDPPPDGGVGVGVVGPGLSLLPHAETKIERETAITERNIDCEYMSARFVCNALSRNDEGLTHPVRDLDE
jgi:hypothetical protein